MTIMSNIQQDIEKQDVLDKVFYQPDLRFSKNHDTMRTQIKVHNETIVQLKNDLQKNQDAVKKIEYKTGISEWLGFFGTLGACVFVGGSLASYFFSNPDIHGPFTFFAIVLSFVISIQPACWVATFFQKFRIKRWKKSAQGQQFLQTIASLEQEIAQKEKQMNETIVNRVTKDYFFQHLNQLDALIAHIKSLYSEHFFDNYVKNKLNYGYNLNLENIRETFIDSYMNGHHHYLVDMVETMDDIVIAFEKAWKDYSSTDKHHLMTEYQDYVNQGEHHIQNIL